MSLTRSAEPEERTSKPRPSKLLAFIGVFVSWWILTAFVYDHTQSNFLRAENGWYLFLSHSTSPVQHEFERLLLTKSFSGHYTPFAFLAEFATAKFIGTRAGFWKWRQITVLALLATMLFLLARNSGYALQLSRLRASLSAASLTAILIFQAQMRHFIAWPFMIMQLFWLLFTVIGLLSLVQMVRRPREILWSWLAAGAAYASLHFLGLGIATVASTAAVLVGIWIGTRGRGSADASKITFPLLSMIALTTFHAVLMLKLPWEKAIAPSNEWQFNSFLMASLGFVPNFAFATLRALFSTAQPTPTPGQITQDWPYGLAILLGIGLLVSSAFIRSLREPTTPNQTRFILRTFASVSFLTIIAMTSVRAWQEPSSNGFENYLTGSRYLIPGTFALAGAMVEFVFLFASVPTFLGVFVNIGLVVCAVTGNLEYARNVYPKVAPKSMISHAHAWRSIVAMARECQRANLAIPNVPLGVLTQEFSAWDLKLFEPLLRADLEAPHGTSLKFVERIVFDSESPNEYDRDVPSLDEVRKRLWLQKRKITNSAAVSQ